MSKQRPSLLIRIGDQRDIVERHLAHVQGVFEAADWSVERDPHAQPATSGSLTAVITDPWLEPLPSAIAALARAPGPRHAHWRTPLIANAQPPQQWQPSNGPYTLDQYQRQTLRGTPRAEESIQELTCALVAAPAAEVKVLTEIEWPPPPEKLTLVRQVRVFRYDDPAGHPRAELVEYVPDSASTIIDIGCGSGKLGERLAGPGRRIIGIEPDPTLADRAAKRLDEVLVMGANQGLARLSGNADVIILADVLEHTDNPELVLTAVANRLAPDGRVIVSLPNSAWIPILAALAKGRWDSALAGVQARDHLRPMTPLSFRSLAAECGLQVRREVPMIAPLSTKLRIAARLLSLLGGRYRDFVTAQWVAVLSLR